MMKARYCSIILGIVAVSTWSCKNNSARGEQKSSEETELNKKEVVQHYAGIVYATYQDCVKTAEEMQKSIDAFIANPTEETLDAAKQAWLVARNPYCLLYTSPSPRDS